MAAHRPEEPSRLGEAAQRPGVQHAVLDQLRRPLDAVEKATKPEQGLQIAQPALAFLDVGLEQIAAVAGALVAGIALGELGLHERSATAGDRFALEALAKLGEQTGVAPQKARLEQIGADRQIGAGGAHAVVDRAGRLPDLQAEIPQPVQQELDHLLGVGRPLVRVQEQQIDVGVRRQLRAAIAADRDHRHALAGGRIGTPEYFGERVVEQNLDQSIDQAAIVGDRRLSVVVGLEARPDRRPCAVEPMAERGQQLRLVTIARLKQGFEPAACVAQIE